MSTQQYPKWDYKDYPKTLPADDLWGQVRRTVHGKPVPETEIEKMVHSIRQGLMFQSTDVLLDIGCGNGALTQRFFNDCAQVHGVDHSDYLVSVANERFSDVQRSFECMEVDAYMTAAAEPQRFTKVLCFGTLGYFSEASVILMLSQLWLRFTSVQRVYLGNLPDPDRAHAFYGNTNFTSADLLQHQSQIGCWRSPAQIQALAAAAGWASEYQAPAADFYQSHYRYNMILKRSAEVQV